MARHQRFCTFAADIKRAPELTTDWQSPTLSL